MKHSARRYALAALLVVACGGQQRGPATPAAVRVETLGGALAGLELDAASYLARAIARFGGDDCAWTLAAGSAPPIGSRPPRLAGSARSGAGWVGLDANLEQTCDHETQSSRQAGQFATNSALGDVSERNAQWSALTMMIDLMVSDLLAPSVDLPTGGNASPAQQE